LFPGSGIYRVKGGIKEWGGDYEKEWLKEALKRKGRCRVTHK